MRLPAKSLPTKADTMGISKQGFHAEAVARTDVQVRVLRPPNYAGPMAILLFAMLIGGLLYMRRDNLDFLYNRTNWGVAALCIIYVFLSGQMWNHIRVPPFMHRNPLTGATGFIHSSSQFQFIVETYIVFAIYADITGAFILMNETDGKRAYFVVVDFDDGVDVFSTLNLNTAPVIMHFSAKSRPTKADTMDISKQGFHAEAVARWIGERTDVQVRVLRPPNYAGPMAILLFAMLIGGLLYMRRDNLDFLYNRTNWGVAALCIIFVFLSGQMWNHIRGPPFMHRNPQTGATGFIHSSSQFQFIVETYIVFAIYAAITGGLILQKQLVNKGRMAQFPAIPAATSTRRPAVLRSRRRCRQTSLAHKAHPQTNHVISSSSVGPIRARRLVVIDDRQSSVRIIRPRRAIRLRTRCSTVFARSLLSRWRPRRNSTSIETYRTSSRRSCLREKALQEHIALFERRRSFDASQADPFFTAIIAPSPAPPGSDQPQPSNSFAGGDFGGQTPRRRPRNDQKKLKPCPLECSFCKNNQQEDWRYHATKDADMKTVCPRLYDYVCPRCNATGDFAHTVRYCPEIYESNQRRLQDEAERNRRISQSSDAENSRAEEFFVMDRRLATRLSHRIVLSTV